MHFYITVKGKLAKNEALQKLKKSIYGDRGYFGDEWTMNLAACSLDQLNRIKQFFGNYKGEGATSAATLLREIGLYEDLAKANTAIAVLQQKAKNLQQLVPMLTKLACLIHKQRLWAREDENEASVWLPYIVTRVVYENPRMREDSPYVRMHCTHIVHGKIQNTQTLWHWHEVRGRTIQELLAEEGWFVPSPTIEADYEYDMELYEDYVQRVGRQFNATGWAFLDGVDDESEGRRRKNSYNLAPGASATRVVRDVDSESGEHARRGSLYVEDIRAGEGSYDEDGDLIEAEDGDKAPVPPIHPYIICHDMLRHRRVAIHVRNLTPYVYNVGLADQLVLPEGHRELINLLTRTDAKSFSDVVSNKSGGVVIICQGLPGTGKTLTAEVISEQQQRPLYSVQCSQLGMSVETIEDNLKLVLRRAARWNAVTLLDEADVYLMARGHSLEHNAIVGVFLRVLEYAAGTLFLTTNRLDAIDDAIVSRSVAVLRYGIPPKEDRIKIWHNLLCANNVPDVSGAGLTLLAELPMSGRDIKNALKLCLLMGKPVTCDNIQFLLQYRPPIADEASTTTNPGT